MPESNTLVEVEDYYPHCCVADVTQIELLLNEIREVLLTRSDGVRIKVTRTDKFPQHNGKCLIETVQIETWDIGA